MLIPMYTCVSILNIVFSFNNAGNLYVLLTRIARSSYSFPIRLWSPGHSMEERAVAFD